MTATEYFESTTKGSKNCQFINWVDVWLYDKGYRITHFGGLVPERFWDKENCKRVVVRNFEVNQMMRIPQTEKELLEMI